MVLVLKVSASSGSLLGMENLRPYLKPTGSDSAFYKISKWLKFQKHNFGTVVIRFGYALESPGKIFKNYADFQASPRHSHIIGLGCGLCNGIFKRFLIYSMYCQIWKTDDRFIPLKCFTDIQFFYVIHIQSLLQHNICMF